MDVKKMETPLFAIDGLQSTKASTFLRLARTLINKTKWASLNLIFTSLGLLPLFISGNTIGIFFFIVFNLPSLIFSIDYTYQLYTSAEMTSNYSLLKVFYGELLAMIAKTLGCILFLIGSYMFFHLEIIDMMTFGVALIMLLFLGIGLYFDRIAAGAFSNFISQDFDLEVDRRFTRINQEILHGLDQYKEGKSLMYFPLFAMIGIYLSIAGLADLGRGLTQYAHIWQHYENEMVDDQPSSMKDKVDDPSFTQLRCARSCSVCGSDSNPMNSRFCGECGQHL
jgi:hypothetical protein